MAARKNRRILPFFVVRTSGSSAFGVDNGSRYHDALAAFRAAAERLIRLAGRLAAVARGGTHLGFSYGIANADNHGRSSVPRLYADTARRSQVNLRLIRSR